MVTRTRLKYRVYVHCLSFIGDSHCLLKNGQNAEVLYVVGGAFCKWRALQGCPFVCGRTDDGETRVPDRVVIAVLAPCSCL